MFTSFSDGEPCQPDSSMDNEQYQLFKLIEDREMECLFQYAKTIVPIPKTRKGGRCAPEVECTNTQEDRCKSRCRYPQPANMF